jgi:uncharacterized DUF497 family protein
MRRVVDIDWDDKKSELLRRERGLTLLEAAELLTQERVERTKNDDPFQILATGYAQGKLLSLVYEIREHENGNTYYWLVTYWNATREERKTYENKIKNRR